MHGGCQVPCCHGNYAELSGCPVDIYRVETPTFSLDQVTERLSFVAVPDKSKESQSVKLPSVAGFLRYIQHS